MKDVHLKFKLTQKKRSKGFEATKIYHDISIGTGKLQLFLKQLAFQIFWYIHIIWLFHLQVNFIQKCTF
jgi:hypothetical protein